MIDSGADVGSYQRVTYGYWGIVLDNSMITKLGTVKFDGYDICNIQF